MDFKSLEECGKPELIRLIASRIQDKGRIPFAEFMEMALYTPGLGYYESSGEKIGPQGDFYTSSDLHSIGGEMLARQVAQVAPLISDQGLVILEMGAGKGLLCGDVLTYFRTNRPELYEKLSYCIVEKSASFVERQRDYLSLFVREGKVRWMKGLNSADFPGGLVGFVFSNELVDAFPVHRLLMENGRLQEVYVAIREGKFTEVLGDPSREDLSLYFKSLGLVLEEGQQAEVNLAALEWMKQVGRLLKKGLVVTVDYGYPASELYAPHRRRGTFLCYFRHRVSENPYDHIGDQDMTAHVDFTSLARQGQAVGLEVSGFTDQQYFLVSLGATERMEERLARQQDPAKRARELAAMKQLIAPSGMGKVFKVLIQHKGMPNPGLQGLAYRPFAGDALFL